MIALYTVLSVATRPQYPVAYTVGSQPTVTVGHKKGNTNMRKITLCLL